MKHNFSIVIKTPERFTQQYVKDFLKEAETVFRIKGKSVPNVLFDTNNTRGVNILGVLLIYKFFEFTVLKQCFNNPSCNLNRNKYLLKELEHYGFRNLVEVFINDKIPGDYSIDYNIKDGVFIAPMVLNRGQSKEKTEELYRAKISSYYKYDGAVSFVILQCLGEIASNFSEHAVEDTKSILVAKGNRDYFEIACADTGNGIVSTLSPILGNPMKERFQVIQKAISKGVSSKKMSGHMGYGLWLIDEFVSATNGEFCVFSEGGYVHRRSSIVKKGECPFWKGTIIYLRIPLSETHLLRNKICTLKEQYCKKKLQRS